MHFHPLPNRMDSTCWVKSKKWFWKDKDTYKKYKKELKERKSRNKYKRRRWRRLMYYKTDCSNV